MKRPLISVLMPVYNGLPLVGDSIRSILSQTLEEFEFLIVDDGSTDGTGAELKLWAGRDARIRIIERPHIGITRALNAGLARARGEFIARMDCGDVSYPERLERQVQFMRMHPECVAVGTHFNQADVEGAVIRTLRPGVASEQIVETLLGHRRDGGFVCHACAMVRNVAMRRVGGYRSQFALAQDRDLWLRLSEIGQLSNVPEVLFTVRVGIAGELSATRAEEQRTYALRAIYEAHQRRGLRQPDELQLWPVVCCSAFDRMCGAARFAMNSGHFDTARKYSWAAFRQAPLQPRVWRLCLRAILGPRGARLAQFVRRLRWTAGGDAARGAGSLAGVRKAQM